MKDRADAAGWRPPPAGAFDVTEHCWIPMADGVRLSARLWVPAGAVKRRVPVVLEYIPYRKRDLYRASDDYWGATLAAHGVAFARVDVRGTGDSEGVLTDEYGEEELADGETIVGWLAAQPWSSGAVGMRGISWGAINTLQVAARRPAGLAAIVAIAGTDNRYTDDAHYLGGLLGRANFQWGTLFKGVMAAPPDPAVVGERWATLWRERLEATPAILTRWLEHQTFDDYWRQGSLAGDYHRIEVPAYLVAGWQDTYSNPLGRLLENLDVPRKGLLGPWGHTYPHTARPVGVDWAYEELRWWAHWLQGETTGIMAEPMLHVFMPSQTPREADGAPQPGDWLAFERWPLQAVTTTLHLNADGLGAAAGATGRRACRPIPPVGLTKPEWLNRLPIEQSYDDARSLTFDSAPLDATLRVLGQPVARVRVRANAPLASLAIRLCEVTPAGESWLVSYGLLNLTHRDGHADPERLQPGVDYDIEVRLALMAHEFSAGNRLRIGVSESLWPLVWPSPTPVEVTLELGVSMLRLPLCPATDLARTVLASVQERAPAPANYEPVLADESGWLRLRERSPETSYQVDGVGTRLTRWGDERCEIHEDEPLSARWAQTATTVWQRDDWHCEVEAGYELTCVVGHFVLSEWVTARSDGAVVFERASNARVPRRLV